VIEGEPCAPAAGDDENGDGDVTWTDDMILDLGLLWEQGLSCSVIATRLNAKYHTDLTRNAVIGKRKRIGIPDRGDPNGGNRTQQRRKKPKRKPRLFVINGRTGKSPMLPTHPELMAQPDDLARVAFEDLENHHCRYIVGDPSQLRGQPMFCGLPRHAGLSYCTGHAARCIPALFIEPQTRAETPVERETELV
jgi:hypothetical protein